MSCSSPCSCNCVVVRMQRKGGMDQIMERKDGDGMGINWSRRGKK